jgi:hypothetical protein
MGHLCLLPDPTSHSPALWPDLIRDLSYKKPLHLEAAGANPAAPSSTLVSSMSPRLLLRQVLHASVLSRAKAVNRSTNPLCPGVVPGRDLRSPGSSQCRDPQMGGCDPVTQQVLPMPPRLYLSA